MSRVDELPPDQRAALSLLLRQHKTYGEVAALLKIPEQAVHDRAHAALAVLAPAQARRLDPAGRAEIGDYLLGQQSAGERMRTRTLLESSPAAGDWARALEAELAPLADGALPDLPAQGAAAQGAPYPLAQAVAESSQAPPAADSPAPAGTRSSRRGGALLLGAIALAAVVVVVVLATKSSGGSHHATTTRSAHTSTGPTSEGRTALHPPDPASHSTGTVQILSEGGKRAFYIQAEHLPPTHGFFYAVWLYNSVDDALPLSKAPAVGSSHKLAGAALLPSNASHYRQILLTRETSTRPRHPGHVVLAGPLNLSS